MEDPIKIIHKYKNNNKRIQYHIYIYIGDILDDACQKVLKKIKNLNLYDSLTTLDEREVKIMVKNYGDFWYEKFFNKYHIHFTKDDVIKNAPKAKELQSIYGVEWYDIHFKDYKKRVQVIYYSFEAMVKEDRERRAIKKIIQKQQQDVEEFIDYSTSTKTSTINLDRIKPGSPKDTCEDSSSDESDSDNDQRGGYDSSIDSSDPDVEECEIDPEELEDSQDGGNDDPRTITGDIQTIVTEDLQILEADKADNEVPVETSREELDDIQMVGGNDDVEDVIELDFDKFTENEFDNMELEQPDAATTFDSEVERDLEENVEEIFGGIEETDKNIKMTIKEIKNVITSDSYNKINESINEFDTSKDNNMFGESLRDIFEKTYITQQYIYKDDTIKMIRQKISSSIKNNTKFGDKAYIIPSYQYMWSEYILNDKIEKVMMGQKWIVKNDILKLDIEPNSNLGVYEDLRGNLRSLRDNIRRHGKIKREDDDNGDRKSTR